MTDLSEISRLRDLLDIRYQDVRITYSEIQLIEAILSLLESLTINSVQCDIGTEILRENCLGVVRVILHG